LHGQKCPRCYPTEGESKAEALSKQGYFIQ
jgi:hypothetical protein